MDYLQVKVKAGKGGDGKVSFRSAIYVEFGGPDGGDGGNGGNVILRANPSYTSLIHISKLLKGEPGENGKGAERHGMSGKDTIVNVPVGTCVFEQVAESKILSGNRSNSSSSSRSNGTSDTVDINEDISKAKSIKYKDKKQKRNSTANDDSNNVDNHESNNNNNSNNLAKSAISSSNINSGNNNNNSNGSNEMSDNNNNNQNTNSLRNTSDAKVLKAIIDLDTPGSEIVIARGGRKGLGNRRFRSSTNQAPNVASPGEEGEEKTIVLELKTIADIGLVGCPNAGKSTLLGAVSNAHPQVAAYPFTTLNPFVGVIEFSDLFRMTMADIPGLVAGAHANKGLGHSFLRHIERSKVLVYIVDTAGVDGRKPWDDLAVLERELELFSPGLSKGLSWRAVQSVDSNGSTNSGNSNSSSGSNNSRVLVVANKMDLPEAQANYPKLKRVAQSKKMNIIPISAKDGVDKIGLLTTTLRSMVESIRKEEQELKLKKQREAKMREKEDKTRAQKQSTTKLQPGKEEKEEGDLDEEAVAYNNFIKSLGFTDRNDRKKRKNSKRRAQMFAHGYSGSQ